jgi:hypothetical protein
MYTGQGSIAEYYFSSDSDEDSNTDGEHSQSDQSVKTEYISDSDNDSNTS